MKYSTEVGSGYWGPSAPLRSAQDVIGDWVVDIWYRILEIGYFYSANDSRKSTSSWRNSSPEGVLNMRVPIWNVPPGT